MRLFVHAAVLSSLFAGCAGAPPPATVASVAPPSPRLADVVYEHRDGQIWIEGHFARVGERWEWQAGRYQAERDGKVWRDGYWDQRGASWHWIPGEWLDAMADKIRVRGHWDKRGDQLVWVNGYWQAMRTGDTWEAGRWQQFGDTHIWRVGRWRNAATESVAVTKPEPKKKKPARKHK